ncbi:uncharacterized protein KY384_004966 [Bacidia gigantensis]|uniref:uncharacterized protein n=1 Tax=Bacidia gigantensis TaxID=2732470 RepID=UPI001D044551|nr:uncharacterized protein KY384_004966 [Bacidia gigantensis]KAG8530463.1 hypothetical protein KY384_004966 [Bacidia gigantensis]
MDLRYILSFCQRQVSIASDDGSLLPTLNYSATPEIEVDPNFARRKRQKSTSTERDLPDSLQEEPESTAWIDQLNAAAAEASVNHMTAAPGHVSPSRQLVPCTKETEAAATKSAPITIGVLIEPTSPSRAEPSGDRLASPRTGSEPPELSSPKRMLRVRPDGKLGTPKKETQIEATKVRRPRRTKEQLQVQKTGLVVIKYGKRKKIRTALGKRIDAILLATPSQYEKINPTKKGDPEEPPNPLIPFLLKKSSETLPAKSADWISNANSGQLPSTKKQRVNSRPPGVEGNNDSSHAVKFPAFGSDHARITRFPGTQEAMWPPSDMVHVGRESRGSKSHMISNRRPQKQRKLKQIPVHVPWDEDILKPVLGLSPSSGSPENAVAEFPTASDRKYRRPRRHVVPGHGLQRLVNSRLIHSQPNCPSNPGLFHNQLSDLQYSHLKAPPVLKQLYDGITSHSTAFDRFECECQHWTSKYSPKAAEHVLQQGQEPTMIRDWLRSLTVTSVNVQAQSTTGHKRQKPSRRKRRRGEELDDFVVSSDEESEGLSSIGDLQGGLFQPNDGSLRTVVRAQVPVEPGARLPHAAVISGPHGCGKSAAVYAIAQELGFEVFEINAGSRRSGKDIVDKVGDMTRNHLVRNDPEVSIDNDQDQSKEIEQMDEKLQQDLESGRQSTMKSFFKKGSTAKASVKEPRSQKQSLILIEEVDILFEEDKLFWPTVLDLIVGTRRPIILTCTDESRLPLGEMILQGIFRFTSPPEQFAVDYMLLVAAAEGHILKRDAVHSLYSAKAYDLRASLSELQFFCQMAVGDRKGGLEWLLIDRPEVNDKTEESALCRVVSEDTYDKGMGWLSGDVPAVEGPSSLEHSVDTLLTVCHNWNLDINNMEHFSSKKNVSLAQTEQQANLERICRHSLSLDTFSQADLLPTAELRSSLSEPLDPTQPKLNEKQLGHFTEGPTVLQADPLEDQTGLTTTLGLTLRAMAAPFSHSEHNSASPSLDQNLIDSICHAAPKNSCIQEPRAIFTEAFHPLVNPPTSTLNLPKGPSISSFVAPISVVATDIAPYVRSIAAYDLRLEAQREQLSAALSRPGRDAGEDWGSVLLEMVNEGVNEDDDERMGSCDGGDVETRDETPESDMTDELQA